jgi:TolB-like protein/Tfp pilus assembly protein PilF
MSRKLSPARLRRIAERAMDPKNFFAELKRRNVYKVAVAYAVVGWLLVQIATQVFPFFEVPNWAVRLVVLAIIIGFPIALIVAWAFELTPEGIKRTETADETSRPRQHVWIYVVTVAAALSVALFFLGRYSATNKEKETHQLAGKSIAVLPFANLSRDPDNEYFAAGIQDEIITRLAQVADLKVISCTSTQRFKGSHDLPQVARELGVAHVLEGSIQKSGDQVHVNVQLINALTDAHLWADIYDRKLTDIFAVESEIAKTIAETLRVKLTGAQARAITARPTDNNAAHELYLKGRYFWNKRTGADLRKAVGYFNQAIEKDPKYALAYAGLADAYQLLSGYGAAAPQESYPPAKAAAKRALELDDSLGEAHASLAKILCYYDLDFAGSTKEFERAIALNPNYATAHQWFGNSALTATGQFERAVAEGRRALELDPLSLVINTDLGDDYFYQRHYDEALEQLRRTLEIDPRFYFARWVLGEVLELKGQLPEALAEYKKAAELDDDPYVLGLIAQACAKLGRRDEALKILQQMQQPPTDRYVADYSLALVHLALGEKEKAIELLERAYRNRVGGDIPFLKVDPMLDSLRGDPRFKALAEKVVPASQFHAPPK